MSVSPVSPHIVITWGALKSDTSPGSTPRESEVIELGYSLPQVIVMCLGITGLLELV